MGKGGPSHTLVSLADSKKRVLRKHSLLCTLLEWSDDTALMRRQRQLAARRSFYIYSYYSRQISLKKDPMTDGIQTDFVGTRGSVMHRMHPTVLCKCHTITGQQTSRGRHRHLLTQHCPLVQQEKMLAPVRRQPIPEHFGIFLVHSRVSVVAEMSYLDVHTCTVRNTL
ncbi:hypothetical protein V8C40DRAFT_115141 [Trichoderma camerunense]